VAALALAAFLPVSASACSICYGEPDSPVSRGLTWAIVALGMIVVGVLAGAVAFFVQANRKAAVIEAADSANSLIEKN
jgi:hypothetical protein